MDADHVVFTATLSMIAGWVLGRFEEETGPLSVIVFAAAIIVFAIALFKIVYGN